MANGYHGHFIDNEVFMTSTPLIRALIGLLLCCVTLAHGADETNIIAEITRRFQPTKATVIMDYDVTYALMNIRLKRVASATLKATEGVWRSNLASEGIPACLINFHLASPQTGDNTDNQTSLYKQTLSVLTMPDLKIITYAKRNDEFIKPFLRKGIRMKNIEIYDFESGQLSYRHHDLLSGVVETNLPGIADLSKQSTEVASVFQTLYAAYHGTPLPQESLASTVHFNVDGAVKTFGLQTKKGRTYALANPEKFSALYVDIQPANEGDSQNQSFSMWCVPFRLFADGTTNQELKNLAQTSLEWSMLPLSGELGLFLGSIQCTLTKIFVQQLECPSS